MRSSTRRIVGSCLAAATAGVFSSGGRAQGIPALSLTRDLRIDAGAEDLSRVGTMVVALDGMIGVSQPQDGNIRFFDDAGRSLGTFGRRGQGPGEFQSASIFGWIGDTLVVGDFGTRRFTLMSPERSMVRMIPWLTAVTVPPDPAGMQPRVVSLSPKAILGDGSWLIEATMAEGSPPFPGVAPDEPGGPTLLVSRDSVVRRWLGWHRPSPCLLSSSSPSGGYAFIPIPLCVMPPQQYAPDGSRVAAITFEEPSGRTGHYRLEVVTSAGDTVVARRYAYDVVRIPSRILDSVRTAQAAMRGAPEIVALRRSMKLPDAWPPLERLVLGRDGTIWIEQYTTAGDRRWLVLTASGDVAGNVTIPRSVRLQVVSRDRVWGTDTDDDGLQHLVRYRVTR